MRDIWAKDGGVYFGFGSDRLKGDRPPLNRSSQLRYIGDRHLVTVGPNGTGKSRRLLLPNLHDLVNWSTVVVDPKGDLALMTKGHREKAGSRIVMLNPFGVHGLPSDGFNPLSALDPASEKFTDDAMGLAEALIRVDKRDPHWGTSAQDLICALVMYVRLEFPNGSLADVRALLGQGQDEFRETILKRTIEFEGKTLSGALATAIIKDCPELGTKVSRFGDITPENKELMGILSTALTQTRWLDSKPVKADLTKSGFDFGSLQEIPTTVYLMLPADSLATHSTWLRVMIASILRPLMKDTLKPKVPVLLMLDEFAQLGHLPIIENTMALMRGYGVKLWAVFQDLAQAKAIYGERWHSFIANGGVMQAFAPQEMETAKALSELMGQTTALASSASEAGPRANISKGQILVPVILPQELMQMGEGYSVIRTHKVEGVVQAYIPYPTELKHMQEICALDPSN